MAEKQLGRPNPEKNKSVLAIFQCPRGHQVERRSTTLALKDPKKIEAISICPTHKVKMRFLGMGTTGTDN